MGNLRKDFSIGEMCETWLAPGNKQAVTLWRNRKIKLLHVQMAWKTNIQGLTKKPVSPHIAQVGPPAIPVGSLEVSLIYGFHWISEV